MKSKIIFEWLSLILLSIVMFSGGMYVALASPFLILIAPAPLMVLEIRQGFRESSAIFQAGLKKASISSFSLSQPQL